jgi:hypothetical protein
VNERSFYGLIVLARLLPVPRDLRVLRALGETMALHYPYNAMLSAALELVIQLQERESA